MSNRCPYTREATGFRVDELGKAGIAERKEALRVERGASHLGKRGIH